MSVRRFCPLAAASVLASVVFAAPAGAVVVVGSADLPVSLNVVGQLALDSASDRVFVGTYQDQSTGSTDPSRLVLVDASNPAHPRTTIIDHSSGRGVVASPDVNALWVGTTGSLVRRDLTTLASLGVLTVMGCPAAMDIDPGANLVYVGTRSNCSIAASGIARFVVIDGGTMTPVGAPVPVATTLHNVHHNTSTGRSYVTHNDAVDGGIAIIGPPPSLTVLGELPGRMLAVNPVANRLYVRTATGIAIYDGGTDTEIATIPGTFGWRGALDSGRNLLYVPDDSGLIAVLNGNDRSVYRFSLGDGVTAGDRMAVDGVKGRLYVAGSDALGNVRMYVVDLRDGQRCTVVVSSLAYGNGDSVTVMVLELRNSRPGVHAPIELKVWLGGDAIGPIGLVNTGAAGTFKLAPDSVRNYGPFSLPPITDGWPRGAYEIGCRLLHPITGRTISENVAAFTVQ